MQTTVILLVNIVVLNAARIVTLENFVDNLIDFPLYKRNEPEYICKDSPVDISLIIDSSRSIHPFDFQRQINFLVKFVTLFDISPNRVRVAAVSFGLKVIQQGAFTFNKYGSTEEVQSGLRGIRYRGGEYGEGTNTALALAFVRKKIFRDARPEAKKLCIVLTDGRSTDPKKTQEEAALLKSEDVQMVAIGIGTLISMEELKGIASNSDLVFTVGNHSLLQTIKKQLILAICTDVEIVTVVPPIENDKNVENVTKEIPLQNDENVKEVTTRPVLDINNDIGEITIQSVIDKNKDISEVTTQPVIDKNKGCHGLLDINFVFNPSQVGTRRIIRFIENVIATEALANDDVRVGIITVPFPDMTGFRLNRYKNKSEIKTHFDEYRINLIAPQVADLRLEAFLSMNGGRPGARKLGIIFLRGKIDDAIEAIIEAKSAHADGIEIYVITTGYTNDKLITNNIATDAEHVLSVSSSNDLPDLSDKFVNLICE